MPRSWLPSLLLSLLSLLVAPAALAQWSSDPAANTALTDAADDQAESKVVATGDGGCYVSWFDADSGYDVKLQRLDAAGRERWQHDGITVADRHLSWVQDYGLAADAAGNAVLAFHDELGADTVVVAQLVQADGTLPWGPDGVELDRSDTAFLAAPEVAATSDGGYVVGWTRDAAVVLRKVDAAGTPLWPAEVVLSDPGGDSFSLSDLQPSDSGGVILSFLSEVFLAHRWLYAQKLDASGGLLWGPAHVAIYDGGSLQLGNFPDLVTDASGGAVFSWYQAATYLQSYVQHVRADGSEAFPHDGVPVSTNPAQQRVGPDAAYNRATGEVFAFWVEESLGQGQQGVYGQKIAASGSRDWTDSGLLVVPVGGDVITSVRTLPSGDGAFVFFISDVAGGAQHVRAARVDGAGRFLCTPSVVDVATAPAGKSDLQAALSTAGQGLLAWSDARSGQGDVYGQNFTPECTLGGELAANLYRGTVADPGPGWQTAALPLTSANDDPTAPFPVATSLGGTATDDLAAAVPLTLYRLLGPGDQALGNVLRAHPVPAGVALTY